MSGQPSKHVQSGPQTGGENRKAADKATQENDLTTGHSNPDDGGADNAKSDNNGPDKQGR